MKSRTPLGTALWILLVLLLVVACDSLKNPFLEELPSEGLTNQPPETHIFITFDPELMDTIITEGDTLITLHLADTSTSQQVLFWWGEDPDGEVVAYHYRWSYQDDWTRTTAETDTFFLPLQVAYDEYLFEVKAEDNSGDLDPSPAILRTPVVNSAPQIEFSQNSNPTAGNNPDVTHVTFPTRTFAWSVSDLDGLETINHIRYKLDSTSTWHYLDRDISSITLTGIAPGLHTFYVQAIDTAGFESNLLQFPDSSDTHSPNGWQVIEPVGDILLIDDFKLDNGSVHGFYTEILDSLAGLDNYSTFTIGYDEKALPGTNADQIAMFNYFKTVVWYHYSEAPNLPAADGALRTYIETGGNVFVSSIFINTDYTFTSIDSNWIIDPTGRMLPGLQINLVDPTVTDSLVFIPELTLETSVLISKRVSAYYPTTFFEGEVSQDLFILDEPRNSNENWTGQPPIAQLFQPASGSGRSIFFSLPLHKCNANNNIIQVMDYLLFEVFE
ncbi:MAG: hypothetical protein U9Q77_00560 [Candidatus Marinimicrobia bacterium]|nr:hypothetical protein [Candidatus Neomarinimicrobiota bacterium]